LKQIIVLVNHNTGSNRNKNTHKCTGLWSYSLKRALYLVWMQVFWFILVLF